MAEVNKIIIYNKAKLYSWACFDKKWIIQKLKYSSVNDKMVMFVAEVMSTAIIDV